MYLAASSSMEPKSPTNVPKSNAIFVISLFDGACNIKKIRILLDPVNRNRFDSLKEAERETDLSRCRHLLRGKSNGFARFDDGLISLLLLKQLQWFNFDEFLDLWRNFFGDDLQAVLYLFNYIWA